MPDEGGGADEQNQSAATKRCSNKIKLAILSFVLVLIVAGVTVGVVFAAKDDDAEDEGNSGGDDNKLYAIDLRWQLWGATFGGPSFLEWETPQPASLKVGESAWVSGDDVRIELQSVADNEARVGVSVTVYCCTRSWDGVVAFIDSGQWGSWSQIRTCDCPDIMFDEQVQVRVNT